MGPHGFVARPKMQKWQKSIFLGLSLKIVSVLKKALFRVKMSHFVSFFMHSEKFILWPPGYILHVKSYQKQITTI